MVSIDDIESSLSYYGTVLRVRYAAHNAMPMETSVSKTTSCWIRMLVIVCDRSLIVDNVDWSRAASR